MAEQAFSLSMPQNWTSPVVLASPHSGAEYPDSFVKESVLDAKRLRSSEDAFVDALFDAGPALGMPLFTAKVPRAYVDLNRSKEELDPALLQGLVRKRQNPRVASGLGVIPRVVANGRAIYRGKLPLSEAETRIENYWRPYHANLQILLDRARSRFGRTLLVDCHSMPHEAVEGLASDRSERPQIVIGDRFGASAHGSIVDRIEVAFVRAGFRVARNAPFAGAYITQSYGRPSRDQHAVQIEIDRSLYMNELEITPLAEFGAVQARIERALRDIADCIGDAMPLAAE